MIVLIPFAVFAVFCLLWPTFTAEPPSGKVYPLSTDDAALNKYFLDVERDRTKGLRKSSEAIRRRYEGITWPAMCWELRQREILRHIPTMPEETKDDGK